MVGRRSARGAPESGANPSQDGSGGRAPQMQRGVAQLLFYYLPRRTVDWEDGQAIIEIGGVRLSSVWDNDRAADLLEEIGQLLDWWRDRGGTVDLQFPDPRSQPGRFTVGLPRSVEAAPLETAFVCRRCSWLSFPGRRELARSNGGASALTCRNCNTDSLRQFGQVFVHGCGELVPFTDWRPWMRQTEDGLWEPSALPVRCQNCGGADRLFMRGNTERVKDMKVVCARCNDREVVDRLVARCPRCLAEILVEQRSEARRSRPQEEGPENGRRPETIVTRTAMRATRYSANDTYYPRSTTVLRLDRPRINVGPDEEQELLARMLPTGLRPGSSASAGTSIEVLAKRLQAAEAAGHDVEAAQLLQRIAQAATSPATTTEEPQTVGEEFVPPADDMPKALNESLAFRTTITADPALEVAVRAQGATAQLSEEIRQKCEVLGLREVSLVRDLPVISATYGYTRRSFEPTYEELGAQNLPTQIRAFPSVDRRAAQRLGRPDLVGTVPVLAREAEHEGLFLSLDPGRVLAWLEANGLSLPLPGAPAQVRILNGLEDVDRYYDDVWRLEMRRMVFGLVHSLSHAAMRTASRFAGIERTSISEYIFLPLLGTVVFDNSSSFQLGGMETLARDHLDGFVTALAEEAMSCLYDSECIDHRGACHGCLHSPEISCRVFNHGLSRSFLIGGHAPWADVATDLRVRGYWSGEYEV